MVTDCFSFVLLISGYTFSTKGVAIISEELPVNFMEVHVSVIIFKIRFPFAS